MTSTRLLTLLSSLPLFVSAISILNGTGNGINEAPYYRNVLWVGGQYNTTPGGVFLQNKMYVEELLPVNTALNNSAPPLVFFHGGFQSGAQWLRKPDGNPGWASYFLNLGYPVYLVDVWDIGRSSVSYPPQPQLLPLAMDYISVAFTAPQLFNKYYQARYHTQWPGNGSMGDPVFETFYSSFLPGYTGAAMQYAMQEAVCNLLARIGERAVFISHSNGGSPAWVSSDLCPDMIRGHVAVEADQSPFSLDDSASQGSNTTTPTRPWGLADIPLTYDPPANNASELQPQVNGTIQFTDGILSSYPCNTLAGRKLTNVAKVPVLFLTGQGSVHQVYDHCLVRFLQNAGVCVDWRLLADYGILGNGHFSMLEKNSDQIAALIEGWVKTLS